MPPRKRAAPADEDDVQLAEPVTPERLAELAAMGWRGPTPSTHAQGEHILARLRQGQPTPPEEGS